MSQKIIKKEIKTSIELIDKELSNRKISLDAEGYFLILLDKESKEIVVEHYSNNIDPTGRALDPATGKPIGCNDTTKRTPLKVYRGRSAKEIGIKLTEGKTKNPISKIDHALYLGRELQKAEGCLISGERYIQD